MDKFSARAVLAIFLGYSLTQKGYKLFDLSNHVVFVSRDVDFKEDNFPFMQLSNESSLVAPLIHHNHNVDITDFDTHHVSITLPSDDSASHTIPMCMYMNMIFPASMLLIPRHHLLLILQSLHIHHCFNMLTTWTILSLAGSLEFLGPPFGCKTMWVTRRVSTLFLTLSAIFNWSLTTPND